HLDPVSVEDPEVALQLLQNNHIDLIMLDISMPTMSGFELCEKLRELPQYKTTPVIFVTVNGDFQSRAQSVLSGGNDLITKPTSPLELALKTTLHLLVPQRLLESVAAQSTNIQPQKLKLADEAQEKESRTQAFAASNPSLTEPEQSVTEPTSDKPTCEPVLTPAESPDLEDQMNNPLFTAVESGPDEFPDDLKQLLSEIEASETASHAQKADSNVAAETESESAALPGPESTEPPAQFAPADQSETTASDANGQTNETIPETPAEIETCGGEPVFTHVTEEQRSIEITCEEPAQNHEEITVIMQNQQNEPLEKVARGAANIMFGDHQATELNVRLTRIALERYGVQANSPLDKTAQSVAQIMFGDDAVTQLHVRLTQIALECYSNRGTTNNYVGNTESTGTTEPHAVPEPVAAHA
ncbi:MAG TPA: response regulator, partial [Verrucomicrobiae bacterium]|nr:response regulator [Verrucomicrobiae bacterium]